MRLVFVHGWAFSPTVWDELRASLPEYDSVSVDLGFLGGEPHIPIFTPDDVLIGHSLGFMWGVGRYTNWHRWIAINSFERFVGACVPEAALCVMQRNLKRDAAQTVAGFYKTIGYDGNAMHLNDNALAEGLDWLNTLDISAALSAIGGRGLVLSSANDPLVRQEATQSLLATSPAAQAAQHPSAAHLLPLRDAAWCASHIREFLS